MTPNAQSHVSLYPGTFDPPTFGHLDASLVELIGDEPVPELRVIGVDVDDLVDEVGVVPVPIRIRPLVVHLPKALI